MRLIIPDEHLNASMRRWLTRLLDHVQHANYVNVTVRRSGRDERFEADWIKHLTIEAE